VQLLFQRRGASLGLRERLVPRLQRSLERLAQPPQLPDDEIPLLVASRHPAAEHPVTEQGVSQTAFRPPVLRSQTFGNQPSELSARLSPALRYERSQREPALRRDDQGDLDPERRDPGEREQSRSSDSPGRVHVRELADPEHRVAQIWLDDPKRSAWHTSLRGFALSPLVGETLVDQDELGTDCGCGRRRH